MSSLLRRRGSGGLEGDGGVDLGFSPGFAPGGGARCCGHGQATAIGGGVPGSPNPGEEPPPPPAALPPPAGSCRRGSGALAARRTGESRPNCARTACAQLPVTQRGLLYRKGIKEQMHLLPMCMWCFRRPTAAAADALVTRPSARVTSTFVRSSPRGSAAHARGQRVVAAAWHPAPR